MTNPKWGLLNINEFVFKKSSRSFVLKYMYDNEYNTLKFCKIQTSTDKKDVFQKLIELFTKKFQSKLRQIILLDKQRRIK